MLQIFRRLAKKYFSDEEALIFILLTLGLFAFIYLFGKILLPVLLAIMFAYLLAPSVDFLNKRRVPYLLAVLLVFFAFSGVFIIALFWLLPKIIVQLSKFVGEIPNMVNKLQSQLYSLQQQFPQFVSEEQVQGLAERLNGNEIADQIGQLLPEVLSFSLATLPSLVTGMIYLIIVPILVFFMLKDRRILWSAVKRTLPTRRKLLKTIAIEMNGQIENYIRGKAIEILLVGGISFITLKFLGLNYSLVLSIFIGLSVLIPFVGAVLVTFPVFSVALLQFGFSSEFYYVVIAYMIIQIVDGNVLVPLLFSEAVNLHPIAIIVAVLFFGGIWGVWGVFFAIPLATLIKAVFNAWPKNHYLPNKPPM